MMTCPKCGREVPEGTPACPECGFELSKNADSSRCPESGTHCEPSPCPTEAERPVRRVPNIPRREPDSLPERPGKESSSDNTMKVILLLIAAAAVIFLAVWLIK